MSKNASEMTMRELLDAYPWARRALFQKFHIGGCASCGFAEEETLADVCARNDNLSPEDVLAAVREAHAADEAFMINPEDLRTMTQNGEATLVDIRSADEFQAVHIPGSIHFTQDIMQEIMNTWPRDRAFVVVDHTGDRSLDAVSYFAGHGFSSVRCLRGGIDAYSREVDSSLPRYTLEQAA
jgi:rhodanese-related sulfurtransferase